MSSDLPLSLSPSLPLSLSLAVYTSRDAQLDPVGQFSSCARSGVATTIGFFKME